MINRETVVQLYQNGQSGMQIAQSLGVTFGRVYQILRAEGVPRPTKPTPSPPSPKTPRERVVDKVLRFVTDNPGLTADAIADGIEHTNHATVGQLLSRLKRDGLLIATRLPGSLDLTWSRPS